MDVRSFVRHLKVADAAVALSRRPERQRVRQRNYSVFWTICQESNLSAEVDDSRVGVIKWQEDAAAGVQFLQGQGLPKVILSKRD